MAADDERRSALQVLRSSRSLAYSTGALTLAAGVVLLLWPDRTLAVVARLAGILLVAVGLGESLEALTSRRAGNYWGLLLARGLVNLGMGAALLFWPGITLTVVVWLFGLDLLLAGLVGFVASRSVPREYGRGALALRSGVSVLVGIAILVWPRATLTVIAFLIAIQLVVVGLILLWSGYQLTRLEKSRALLA